MSKNNVQIGLLVGILVLFTAMAFRSPVGRYEFISHNVDTVLRLDTRSGKIVLCERSEILSTRYSCHYEPIGLPVDFKN